MYTTALFRLCYFTTLCPHNILRIHDYNHKRYICVKGGDKVVIVHIYDENI